MVQRILIILSITAMLALFQNCSGVSFEDVDPQLVAKNDLVQGRYDEGEVLPDTGDSGEPNAPARDGVPPSGGENSDPGESDECVLGDNCPGDNQDNDDGDHDEEVADDDKGRGGNNGGGHKDGERPDRGDHGDDDGDHDDDDGDHDDDDDGDDGDHDDDDDGDHDDDDDGDHDDEGDHDDDDDKGDHDDNGNHKDRDGSDREFSYLCILKGPGSSVKLAFKRGGFEGDQSIPDSVCMSKRACTEIVSEVFSVKYAKKSAVCKHKHNSKVQHITDREIMNLLKLEPND